MFQARHKKIKSILFLTLDIVSLLVAMVISFLVLFSLEVISGISLSTLISFIAIIAISLISNFSVGLYKSKVRENFRNMLRRCTLSAGLAFLFYQLIISLLPYEPHNLTLLAGILVGIMFQVLWRNEIIIKGVFPFLKRTVVFVGAGERASFVAKRMRRQMDRRNFSGWGFVPLGRISDVVELKEKVLTGDNLSSILDSECPDVIVLANEHGENIESEMLLCAKMNGADIVGLEDFIESELGQIAVEKISPEWLLVSKGFNLKSFIYEKLNYVFNLIMALIVASLTWPLMIIAIVAIYFEDGKRDGAPFIYKQTRVGKGGELFSIFKFRSMGKNAEKDGVKWAEKNDARVTKVGNYLRKYRIDELPQLFNVIRGDMCFVGPRPERPEFIEQLASKIPYFKSRHLVKPGLTGWAQINYPYGSSENDSFEKLKFDLYYIKHKSFMLDLFTLFRTVEIVLFGQGR